MNKLKFSWWEIGIVVIAVAAMVLSLATEPSWGATDDTPTVVTKAEAFSAREGVKYADLKERIYPDGYVLYNTENSRDFIGPKNNAMRVWWKLDDAGRHITKATWIQCPPYEGPEQPGWPCVNTSIF